MQQAWVPVEFPVSELYLVSRMTNVVPEMPFTVRYLLCIRSYSHFFSLFLSLRSTNCLMKWPRTSARRLCAHRRVRRASDDLPYRPRVRSLLM